MRGIREIGRSIVTDISPESRRAASRASAICAPRSSTCRFPSVDEGYGKARKEAEKALELDPNLAEAHAAVGRIKTNYDWDWTVPDEAYQRALELEPENADAVRGAAALAATHGPFDEAIKLDAGRSGRIHSGEHTTIWVLTPITPNDGMRRKQRSGRLSN